MNEHAPLVGLLTKKVMGVLMMMQARNQNHDDEHGAKWYEITASLGHLVLATLLAIIGGGSVVFGYMWDNHKAITLLQERQIYVLKYIAEDAVANTDKDRRMVQSLATISHQVEELILEVVRHMAASQAVTDYNNGNAGIKRR